MAPAALVSPFCAFLSISLRCSVSVNTRLDGGQIRFDAGQVLGERLDGVAFAVNIAAGREAPLVAVRRKMHK